MKVIIINGGSCSGKSTISKEICKIANNQFVHLQIDKIGDLLGTIFPKGFIFAKNEEGTESNDNGLKGLFNNNRFARRKVVAGIYISTCNELLSKGFNVVLDTALDGPDATSLAKFYLENLKSENIVFVGIFCPVEERLKRLKTRTDNLFLTEEFIKMQSGINDVFDACKEFYDETFDSSKLGSEEIANQILKKI